MARRVRSKKLPHGVKGSKGCSQAISEHDFGHDRENLGGVMKEKMMSRWMKRRIERSRARCDREEVEQKPARRANLLSVQTTGEPSQAKTGQVATKNN